MAVETVFVLPGQGGYAPGAFAGRATPEVWEVFETVDKVATDFGRSGVSDLLMQRDAMPAAQLMEADSFALQLAVFAAAVGGFRLAMQDREPDVVMGHSMGEIAALTVAGAFTLADGARLVCHRSEALLAHSATPGGMLALELSAARTGHLVGAVGAHGLTVAVSNAPQQTVVSGPSHALQTVARAAEAIGALATPLHAPFPFHSEMLAVAANEFSASVADIPQRPLRLTTYSPAFGDYVTNDSHLTTLLARQMTHPVEFLAALRALHAEGARSFVECGRAGLSGLIRRSLPEVTTISSTGDSQTTATPPVPSGALPAEKTRTFGVIDELRALYASTLGYPIEAVTADADLEADLGIDSLKRAQMAAKVLTHFSLTPAAEDGRLLAPPTLAELAVVVSGAQTPTR